MMAQSVPAMHLHRDIKHGEQKLYHSTEPVILKPSKGVIGMYSINIGHSTQLYNEEEELPCTISAKMGIGHNIAIHSKIHPFNNHLFKYSQQYALGMHTMLLE